MRSLILLSLLALPAHATSTACNDTNSTTPSSCLAVIKGYIQQGINQIKPFSIGMLTGAGVGILETEAAVPLLAHLDDGLALGVQLAALGGVGYIAYENQDDDIVQTLKRPATIVGILAGLAAWYSYAGEGLGL